MWTRGRGPETARGGGSGDCDGRGDTRRMIKSRLTIYTNARVVTLDPERPCAEAVLVRGGRVLALGSAFSITDAASHARVVDLAGDVLFPGFIEPHSHVLGYGMAESQSAAGRLPARPDSGLRSHSAIRTPPVSRAATASSPTRPALAPCPRALPYLPRFPRPWGILGRRGRGEQSVSDPVTGGTGGRNGVVLSCLRTTYHLS